MVHIKERRRFGCVAQRVTAIQRWLEGALAVEASLLISLEDEGRVIARCGVRCALYATADTLHPSPEPPI
jgi:hypothetical protein